MTRVPSRRNLSLHCYAQAARSLEMRTKVYDGLRFRFDAADADLMKLRSIAEDNEDVQAIALLDACMLMKQADDKMNKAQLILGSAQKLGVQKVVK